MRISRRGAIGAALAATTLGRGVGAQTSRERPFRLVVNVGLQVLDPIAGASFVTRNFGYVVFDTLVGMDMQGRYRPQMLTAGRSAATAWPGISSCARASCSTTARR